MYEQSLLEYKANVKLGNCAYVVRPNHGRLQLQASLAYMTIPHQLMLVGEALL